MERDASEDAKGNVEERRRAWRYGGQLPDTLSMVGMSAAGRPPTIAGTTPRPHETCRDYLMRCVQSWLQAQEVWHDVDGFQAAMLDAAGTLVLSAAEVQLLNSGEAVATIVNLYREQRDRAERLELEGAEFATVNRAFFRELQAVSEAIAKLTAAALTEIDRIRPTDRP